MKQGRRSDLRPYEQHAAATKQAAGDGVWDEGHGDHGNLRTEIFHIAQDANHLKIRVLGWLAIYHHCFGGELPAHRIRSAEKAQRHRLIDDRDLPSAGHVAFCEPAAARQLQLQNLQEIRAAAVHADSFHMARARHADFVPRARVVTGQRIVDRDVGNTRQSFEAIDDFLESDCCLAGLGFVAVRIVEREKKNVIQIEAQINVRERVETSHH